MSAPQYVPHGLHDRPRRGEPLPPAGTWRADRPGDLTGRQPSGRALGSQGPDQGYVLKLVRLFDDRVQVAPGEHRHDIDAGAVAVALKRASLFGRAPVSHDLDVAYRVFGFLDPAPPAELREARATLFHGAGHDYARRRAVADAVPGDTLRLTPSVVAERHRSAWRDLLAI